MVSIMRFWFQFLYASSSPLSTSTSTSITSLQVSANPSTYNISWRQNGKRLMENVTAGIIFGNQTLVIQKVAEDPRSVACLALLCLVFTLIKPH